MVVLTRPQGKNEALMAELQGHGLQSIALPALSIEASLTVLPPSYDPAAFDLLVFVSAQAVRFYLDALQAANKQIPVGQRIATVGAASAQPFYEAGLDTQLELIHPPAAHPYQDSEALWQLLQPRLAEFDRVLLVRGQQGREWLSQQLIAARKKLSRCSIYQRVPAVWSTQAVQPLQQALIKGETIALLLSSSESVQAIYANVQRLGLESLWQQAAFVAIHPRIAQCLYELTGLTTVQTTLCAPSQPAMLNALLAAAMPKNA